MLHGLSRLRWPLLGGAAALLVFTATAVAGSGVGGVFNLGVTNTVDAQTTLSGNPGANPLLRLTSTGTGATIRADAGSDVAINGISNSGTGQFGQSTTGSGLLGLHSGSSGLAAGAEGRTASTAANAVGVLGKTTSASPAVSSVGVKGLNADGIGVFGEADLSILGCTQTDTICPNFLTNEAHVTNSALAGAFYAPQPRGNALVACAGGGCSTAFVDGGIAGQFSAGVGGTAVQGRLPVNGTGFGADFDAGNGIGIRAVGKSAAGLFFGDVRVTGDLTKDYVPGSPIRAIPIAYAGINAGGSVIGQASTPNVTSTFDSVNHRYVITIAGQSADVNHSVTTVTPIATTPRFATVSSSGSNLTVRIFDLSGAAVQNAFMFTTSKP